MKTRPIFRLYGTGLFARRWSPAATTAATYDRRPAVRPEGTPRLTSPPVDATPGQQLGQSETSQPTTGTPTTGVER